MTAALTQFEHAREALAKAVTVDEVKAIRDKAEAMRLYCRQAADSLEMQNHCAAIKLRAERKAGEMLEAMPKHNGDPLSHDVTRLSDLGISRMQSSRWQAVASLPEDDFEAYIESTVESGKELTTAGALKLAKRHRAAEPVSTPDVPSTSRPIDDLSPLIAAGEKFGCIYADPPWAYGNQGTRASTGDHYVTMSVEDIAAMPVVELAADNAHLHIWTTNAFLFETKAVMEAWGFEYKSCFVWVKPQMGMGNYWRVSHEFLLLGVRGKPEFRARDEMSWGEFPRGQHSAKPEGIRLLVERVSSGPYLELFGRNTAPGWTVFGNQVQPGLFDNA